MSATFSTSRLNWYASRGWIWESDCICAVAMLAAELDFECQTDQRYWNGRGRSFVMRALCRDEERRGRPGRGAGSDLGPWSKVLDGDIDVDDDVLLTV